jgi:2'-5' RNA ligase
MIVTEVIIPNTPLAVQMRMQVDRFYIPEGVFIVDNMNPPRPPYFIGIALPQNLSDHIFAFKRKLHDEINHSLKPLVPHITLLHPPGLRGVRPQEILPDIREIAKPYLPLTLSLEAVGTFDSNVFYISVCSPELEKLQMRLVELLPSDAQEIYHNRRFIPHVTLVQARAPHSLNIEALGVRAEQEFTLPCDFSVDAISCFTQSQPREYKSETI